MELHPWAITKGAPTLARDWHCSVDEIIRAKRLLREKGERRDEAKILIFDIETAPLKAWVWNRWKQDVHLEQTISEWFMICWSAKWLGSEEVMGDCLTPHEILKEDDSRITESIWDLINEADIVITHNGDNFDLPKLNSRFIVNGLVPPSTYQSIDTCKVAKKVFGFSSNKLDALAGYFGYPQKLETNFDLWRQCLEGDREALNYMLKYNKNDVLVLENVYLRLRPYIKNHPNLSNITNELCCPCCGSHNIEREEGKYYRTAVSKFGLYRCKDCGALMRDRVNSAKGEDKIKLVSVQR